MSKFGWFVLVLVGVVIGALVMQVYNLEGQVKMLKQGLAHEAFHTTYDESSAVGAVLGYYDLSSPFEPHNILKESAARRGGIDLRGIRYYCNLQYYGSHITSGVPSDHRRAEVKPVASATLKVADKYYQIDGTQSSLVDSPIANAIIVLPKREVKP